MASDEENFWNYDEPVANSTNNAKLNVDQRGKKVKSGKDKINLELKRTFGEPKNQLKQSTKSAKSTLSQLERSIKSAMLDEQQIDSAQINEPPSIPEPKPINDAAKMDSLAQEILQLGNAQPNYDNLNFTTDELIRLKELLDDALDELSISNGDSLKSKQCTRCNTEFDIDNNNVLECRKHSGFFIEDKKHENEGRWVILISKN